MKKINHSYNLDSALEYLEENTNAKILAKKQEISKLNRQIEDLIKRKRKIENNLPELMGALEKENLEINRVWFYDSNIEFDVIPRGEFHKKIEMSYDNDDELYQKANDLMKVLSNHTNNNDFEWEINPYSFENRSFNYTYYPVVANFNF